MTAKKTPALKASANKATSSQHTAPNTSANTANEALIQTLKARFEAHPKRHPNMAWQNVEARLSAHPDKLKVLQAMEDTGGEPDVVAVDHKTGELTFVDCSAETPAGRRSVCYDAKALASRKENKPKTSALELAVKIGITLLNEDEYRHLQSLGNFDAKTSSWIETPADMRALGGALFGDYRFGRVFTYHNGAESYYAVRGFRGSLKV
ncbi:MAG: hypothetical protein RI932_763 [Pseudomonadota bacterium]|jgi:hypothetical protein